MKRRFRLTRSTDFQRVRRIGKSYAHPLIVFLVSANDLDHARIGIVAGRAVGNAVERNRAKRRLRAALQPLLGCISGGCDIVFLARKPITSASFSEISTAVQSLLKRANLLHDRT